MAIIALKAWYLESYEPVQELEHRPHDLRLSKNSLLKSGLRADFLDESDAVRKSAWFQRYLEGQTVEFYIEGSGGYAISNIDIISHEIYFTKRDLSSLLDPCIFLCHQRDYPGSSELIRDILTGMLDRLNQRSRFSLELVEAHRPLEGPLKLTATLMRQIRQSLIAIADCTAIARTDGTPSQLLPSAKVCLELGYALHSKKPEQILVLQQLRSPLEGEFPFDLPPSQYLTFKGRKDLAQSLEAALTVHLQRFNLLT